MSSTPPSGSSISILQIRDALEPGDGSALNLNFYRGKTYARASPFTGTRTISNSPAMSEFYDLRQNLQATITFKQIFAEAQVGAGPMTAYTQYTLGSDGIAFGVATLSGPGTVTNNGSFAPEWRTSGSSSSFECIWIPQLSTPNPSGDASSVWLNLGTTRTWFLQQTGSQASCVGLVQIRPAGGGSNITSATVQLRSWGIRVS